MGTWGEQGTALSNARSAPVVTVLPFLLKTPSLAGCHQAAVHTQECQSTAGQRIASSVCRVVDAALCALSLNPYNDPRKLSLPPTR